MDIEIKKVNRCEKCILPVSFPNSSFDVSDVCSFCGGHKISPSPIGTDVLRKKIVLAAEKE